MQIFWKYITGIHSNMLYVGIFVKHTLCSLHWNNNNVCKTEQREANSFPGVRISLVIS